MHTPKNLTLKLHQHQRGQAMVEYAILLILLVTLIMGGLELSVTAYHSKKTGDAAEAGANSWAEAIGYSTKSNQGSKTNQDLLELYRESLNIDTDTNLADRDEDGFLIEPIIPADCDVLPGDTCPDYDTADAVRPVVGISANHRPPNLPAYSIQTSNLCFFTVNEDINGNGTLEIGEDVNQNGELDIGKRYYYDMFDNFAELSNDTLPIDITNCSEDQLAEAFTDDDPDENHESFLEYIDVSLQFESHPLQDFDIVCTSKLDEGIEKIVKCRGLIDKTEDDNQDGILNSEDINLNGTLDLLEDINENGLLDSEDINRNGVLDNVPNGIDDLDPTFRRLLIRKDLAGGSSAQPIQNGVVKRIGLGDHDPARTDVNPYRRPSCSATVNGNNADYDNGLPQDGRIYLFNPLPINISNCTGDDPFRHNRSRISILIGGYTNNANPSLNIEGLPALNQAIYSQYTKVCVVENAGQISIATATGPSGGTTLVGLDNCSGNGRAIWLKPPGKMCGAAGGSEVCPDPDDEEGDGDFVISLNGATGFYLFGHVNDPVEDANGDLRFEWNNNETLTSLDRFYSFRPAFQIVCSDLNHNAHQSVDTDPNGDCAARGNGSFALEVHTRYRAILSRF